MRTLTLLTIVCLIVPTLGNGQVRGEVIKDLIGVVIEADGQQIVVQQIGTDKKYAGAAGKDVVVVVGTTIRFDIEELSGQQYKFLKIVILAPPRGRVISKDPQNNTMLVRHISVGLTETFEDDESYHVGRLVTFTTGANKTIAKVVAPGILIDIVADIGIVQESSTTYGLRFRTAGQVPSDMEVGRLVWFGLQDVLGHDQAVDLKDRN